MKILILGSEGFIGSHLAKYYRDKNWQVHGADLYEVGTQPYSYFKISRLSPEYDEILQRVSFDVCINAAGSSHVPYSLTHPVSDFEANALDTIRILDGLRKHQPKCRYLHISSAAVYGNPVQLPVQESSRLSPISPYGWHKLVSENICHEYHSIYKTQNAIIRPFSIYGPGLKKQLFWDIYKKYKENPDRIELWGNGKESRDFIYIEDVVRAIDCIINLAPMEGEVYNIANGIEVSIEEAAAGIFNSFNKKPLILFNNVVREGDPLNWRADITKISSLGFKSAYSFAEGINKVSKWLQNQN